MNRGFAVFGIALSFLSFLLLFGCTVDTSSNHTFYSFEAKVKDCPLTFSSNTEYYLTDNGIVINDTIPYVCCANISVEDEWVNDTLYLTEVNTGGYCKCPKCYNVIITIHSNPMPRRIVLKGVKYEDFANNVHIKPEVRLNITIDK